MRAPSPEAVLLACLIYAIGIAAGRSAASHSAADEARSACAPEAPPAVAP